MAEETQLSNGTISIVFNGVYNEEAKIWGKPYSIQFWVTQPKSYGLSGFKISELEFIELMSDKRVFLGESTSGKIRSDEDNDWAVASFSSDDVGPNNYVIKAKVEICSSAENVCKLEKVQIQVKVKASKERHVNKFDEIMSV